MTSSAHCPQCVASEPRHTLDEDDMNLSALTRLSLRRAKARHQAMAELLNNAPYAAPVRPEPPAPVRDHLAFSASLLA